MSKKVNKSKSAKKPVKPSKGKASAKKVIVAKKASPKVVLKKSVVKKMAKSVKKKPAKKIIAKPIKKVVVTKKNTPKAVKKAISTKKIVVKKEIKKIVPKKIEKTAKEKGTIAKSFKPVKKVKEEKFPAKKVSKPIDIVSQAPKEKSRKSKRGRKPKNKDGDDEPEIVIDELLEQIINSTKKRFQKKVKVPKILKTFVNPMASLTVALPKDGAKKIVLPKKEPKGKFELEYVIRTSAGILYEFLTTPSGLSEWFADDVNIHEGFFTFYWDGSEQKAKLLGFKDEKFVRFQWVDKPDGTYFEFKIERDDLTGDISLIITDFADEASDLETSKLLWDSQVNKLLHVIGSY